MPYKDREKQLASQREWQRKQREDPDYRAKVRIDRKRRDKELAYRIGQNSGSKGLIVPVATRRALVTRAKGNCENTDGTPCKGWLGIHHIDEDPENHELSNLLLLCARHHNKEEHGFGTAIRG